MKRRSYNTPIEHALQTRRAVRPSPHGKRAKRLRIAPGNNLALHRIWVVGCGSCDTSSMWDSRLVLLLVWRRPFQELIKSADSRRRWKSLAEKVLQEVGLPK
eukprot:4148499-Amphidinium_carterae.1